MIIIKAEKIIETMRMSAHADLNKDKFITVSELQNYILNNVSKLTDGMQKPTMRQENIENDFVIWETK